MTPRGVANLDPRGMIGRIYEGYNLTLLHTKYIGFRPCGFREDFFIFFHYKPMLDNDAPGAWPIWASVGRIYEGGHKTLIHIKYSSSGSHGFRKEDFFRFSPL